MKKVLIQSLLFGWVLGSAQAENLNYNFINPSFLGGNPNNAPGLLNLANAQNSFKAPVDSAAIKLQKNIESAIFSKLQANILDAAFGKSSVAGVVGDYETVNFKIHVEDGGLGKIIVTTTDKTTGATTQFTVDPTTNN